MPHALDKTLFGPTVGFVYKPDGVDLATGVPYYNIHAGQIDWNVLGTNKATGAPIAMTKVWGYGNGELPAAGLPLPVTFPGRSFEVMRDAPIDVHWYNDLNTPAGNLPHLLPVDQTVALQTDPTGAAVSGVPIAIHHHGGDTAFEFDGGPDQSFTPKRVQIGPGVDANNLLNQTGTPEALANHFTNAQEASMHWYHDHAEGVTRTNAYAGLAGLYVVRDANEMSLIAANAIPSGAYELPLVIQDRLFTSTGQMAYPADPAMYPAGPLTAPTFPTANPTHFPEAYGDIITVNGVAWPNRDVEPREYRLRLLNGSDARVYTLSFGGLEIFQIGTDLGLCNTPVQMPGGRITIAPGERIDIVVDFSKVQFGRGRVRQVTVTNTAMSPFPLGMLAPAVDGAGTIMRFNVVKPLSAVLRSSVTRNGKLQLRGRPVPLGKTPTPLLPAKVVVPLGATVRRMMLGEGTDEYGRITPMLGVYDPTGVNNVGTMRFADNTTTITTRKDATGKPIPVTEVWEFWNATVDSHPIHMHLVQFRVLSRQPFSAPTDPATGLPMANVVATQMTGNWSGVQIDPALVVMGLARKPDASERDGWKDTVLCPPGEVTRVVVSFNRTGKYVYHCHILSHEEHDMMAWFQVV